MQQQPHESPSSQEGNPAAASTDSAAFDFTPVRLRYRHDGWTPERQLFYVAALAATGHLGKAARAVGMTGQSAARLRRRTDGAGFARTCELAVRGARRRRTMARLASNSPRCAQRSGLCDRQGS